MHNYIGAWQQHAYIGIGNMTIALTVYWSYQAVIEKGGLQRE